LSSSREIVVLRHANSTLLPAGELLIQRFNLLQHRSLTRHLTQDVPFIAVPRTQGEARQRVEDIELGQSQAGNTTMPETVTQAHRIKPPTATLPPSGGTKLLPTLLDQTPGAVM